MGEAKNSFICLIKILLYSQPRKRHVYSSFYKAMHQSIHRFYPPRDASFYPMFRYRLILREKAERGPDGKSR